MLFVKSENVNVNVGPYVSCRNFFIILLKQAGAELSQARLGIDQIMLCQTQLG